MKNAYSSVHRSVVLLFVLPFSLFAQESPSYYAGGGVGYGHSWHNTIQPVYRNAGDCGQFADGSGEGMVAHLGGEVVLLPWLRGVAQLVFAQLSGEMKVPCDNGIIVWSGKDNDFVPLVREHRKDVRLDYGLVELGVKFVPLEVPLFATLGISVGAPIFRADFLQDERIVSPDGALFPDFSVRRETASGAMDDTQLRTALIGGVGYTVSLHNNVEASPEISYAHALTNATTSDDWKINHLRAGISVKWGFGIPEPPPPPTLPPPPPPPPTPPPTPTAMIGTTTDASISITETFVTETFPILPYIFFEKGSESLSDKYRQMDERDAATFTEAGLPRKTLDIYYHILDIMGRRLRDNPKITITLIGSTDDRDIEQGNDTLARHRAEAVMRYFTDVWKISAKRIAITTQRLPPIPTSRIYAEGDEENRRVDIASQSDELFRPVVHERFSEYAITPPTMEMSLGSESSTEMKKWSVTVRHQSEEIASFGGEGSPPPILRWQLDDAFAARMNQGDELDATLSVTDANDNSARSQITIPVMKQQSSFEIGRLSLIVFDFDRSDMLPHNQRMIKRFVAEAIKPTSEVMITGSTDRLGEADHNEKLSTARAENVKAILLTQNPAYRKLESRGIGEAPDLFDNDLPEGRFYCRTVAVEVKTPLELEK